MTEHALKPLWRLGGCAVVVTSAAVWLWDGRTALGAFVGGCWNLASLWCLSRLLTTWMGKPISRRRLTGWLVVKFPLLYLLAFLLLARASVSFLGFGIGFSVVLFVAIGWFALQAQRMVVARSHGR